MSLKSHSFAVSASADNIVVVMNRRTATLVKDALEVVTPDRQCDEDVARNLALHIEVQISRGTARKTKTAPKPPSTCGASFVAASDIAAAVSNEGQNSQETGTGTTGITVH